MRCTLRQMMLVLLCCTTACQPNLRVTYLPIVDGNVDEDDISDCQGLAKPIQDNTIPEGLVMALVGAGIGAAVGSTYGAGFAGQGAQYGAIGGAVIGTANGQTNYNEKTKQVVDNCLRERGYAVLGRP